MCFPLPLLREANGSLEFRDFCMEMQNPYYVMQGCKWIGGLNLDVVFPKVLLCT